MFNQHNDIGNFSYSYKLKANVVLQKNAETWICEKAVAHNFFMNKLSKFLKDSKFILHTRIILFSFHIYSF